MKKQKAANEVKATEDIKGEATDSGFDAFLGVVTNGRDTTVVTTMMKDMLYMQETLNCKFVGPDWRDQARERTRVNYGAAILEEAQEMQASDPSWKWWKKAQPADMGNMRVELVDLLHFVMSEALSNQFVGSTAEGEEADDMDANDPSNLLGMAIRMEEGYRNAYEARTGSTVSDGFKKMDGDAHGVTASFPYNRVMMINALHAMVASVLQGINSDTAEFEPEKDSEMLYLFEDNGSGNEFESVSEMNWTAFWSTALHTGMSLSDVYGTYMGKAVLNSFRIANGDKAGTYNRVWSNGQDDNQFLMAFYESKFSANGVYPSIEETTAYLTSEYSKSETIKTQASLTEAQKQIQGSADVVINIGRTFQ